MATNGLKVATLFIANSLSGYINDNRQTLPRIGDKK